MHAVTLAMCVQLAQAMSYNRGVAGIPNIDCPRHLERFSRSNTFYRSVAGGRERFIDPRVNRTPPLSVLAKCGGAGRPESSKDMLQLELKKGLLLWDSQVENSRNEAVISVCSPSEQSQAIGSLTLQDALSDAYL